MRRMPGLIVVVVLAVAAGCGGGSEEEQAIKDVVADFSGAMKEKDTKTACSLLTERAKGELAELGKQLSADSCGKTLSIVMAYDAEFSKSFSDDARNVEVTGGTAKADMGDTTATLVKEGGAWKLDVDAGG